jgi:PAS domain S-box-containing protein
VRSAFLRERFRRAGFRGRTLEVCLFLALACSCSAALDSDRTIVQFARTASLPIPPGSYKESCTDIEMGDGRLRATCQNKLGRWVKTELYDPSRCARDIENSNGQLTCAGSTAPPPAPRDWERTIGQFQHTEWGPKDGAPSPVTRLAQSADGYLWLGTHDGLYRFDGVVFERYQPQSGGPFPIGAVSSLLALPNGDLWIAFMPGAISLLRQGIAMNYTTRDGVPNGGIWSFAQDRDGTIWAATSGGLVRLEGNRWKEVGEDWNFPGKTARAVFLDRQGTLWVSTEDSLVFLPPGAKRFQPTGIRVGVVTKIAQAANGKLWMAEVTRSVRPIPLSDKRLPPDETEVQVGSQGILFDNDGALWITSMGDGLRRSPAPELLRDRIKEFSNAVESFTAKDGLSDDIVSPILQDREGNIWVGSPNGLDRFRKTDLTPVVFPFKPHQPAWVAGDAGDVWVYDLGVLVRVHGGRADRGLPFPQVDSAYRDPTGTIWWLCLDAIYRYDAGNFTKISYPPSFPKPNLDTAPQATEDGSGALWLSAEREGVFYREKGVWHHLDTASEFAKLTPRIAFTDWMGRAWFGYEEGTILLLKDENIQRVFSANESQVGSVRAINGRGRHIWAAGQLGLAFFDGNRFRRIVPADAETFGSVGGVEETSDGSLWLAEGRRIIGIPAMEVQKALDDPSYRVKYRAFDSFDGLPGTFAGITGSPRAIQGTDDRLWFMASHGIVWVDPANISTNALLPPVLIRSVRANGRQAGSLTNLALPPRTTNLQIGYTALSLSVPEKVRFRYRLDGVDKEWQDAGTRREAFYNSLGPGDYHFRVIACNNDGVWNEEGAHLDFAIAPAWYQTIWFRLLCAAAFLAFLWGLYQLRVQQLRREERKFREAFETIPAMAWIAGPNDDIQFLNRRWVEYTGLSQMENPKGIRKVAIHPDDLDRIERRLSSSIASGEPVEEELRFRRTDGEYRWFLSRIEPLRDKRGKVVKWYGTATDIQDRKRAEELQADFAHTNRVSTLGEMAASLSHEIKQPIAAAVNSANSCIEWLAHEPPNLERARAAAARIDKYGNRAAEIIDRIRSFYKKSPPQRELVEMNGIILEMLTLLKGEATRYSIEMRTELAAGLPKIMADRVQLQQVLMNLMMNGIEAMKDTGGEVTVKSQLGEDGQIEISVNDTGPGLPLGKANQIFDAFFTTKPQGSGMGLPISKSIVESHGGRIWANGDGGRGATFHFTLPAAPAETNPPVNAA